LLLACRASPIVIPFSDHSESDRVQGSILTRRPQHHRRDLSSMARSGDYRRRLPVTRHRNLISRAPELRDILNHGFCAARA
jgi:hypothetical protein